MSRIYGIIADFSESLIPSRLIFYLLYIYTEINNSIRLSLSTF